MSRFSYLRPLSLLAAVAVLCAALTLPALALFDRGDTGLGVGDQPIAENLTLATYKNVAVTGNLAAIAPGGAPVTFRITKQPARGALTFASEGGARFTYTPYENKTGKDTFTYVAEDGEGNVSEPATVSVKITKPATKVVYGDMGGNSAHKAAIALAERNIFVGEKLGDTWFFRPDAAVSRQEFLAMAMDTVGLETLSDTPPTGFSDNDSIAVWAKPYVASALRGGMIQGSQEDDGRAAFHPDQAITQSEAAVLLNRLLRVADVADNGRVGKDAAPTWAYQSVVNLEAVGVLSPSGDGVVDLQGQLTRAQAAELLASALDVLEFRSRF